MKETHTQANESTEIVYSSNGQIKPRNKKNHI